LPINYRFAPVFLATLLLGILRKDTPREELQDAQIRSEIEFALKAAQYGVGLGELPKQIPSNNLSAYVWHMADALKQIRIKTEQEHDQLRIETSGGTVIPGTFSQLYNIHAHSMSAEQSKLAIMNMFPVIYNVVSKVFGTGLAELRKLERDTYRFAESLDRGEEDDDESDDDELDEDKLDNDELDKDDAPGGSGSEDELH
jgi:hypothetical protein